MRHLDHTYLTIAENLALEEALLVDVEERGRSPVLRTWEQREVTVVMGASCRWRDEVRVDACQADGVPIARRSSGGGTVVIGPGALNVAVVLPLEVAPGLAAVEVAQKYVLDRLAAALRAFGPPVEVLGSGDLTLAGRKFAGSAQRRLRRHFLVHVSMLYRFPLDRIGRYLAPPPRQPAYREGRPHDEFVTNLDLPRDQVLAAVHSAWPADEEPGPLPEDLVRQLVAAKFADPAWVERL